MAAAFRSATTTLNQVYANVLNKPILVPQGDVTSLGSAIFAFLAAGAFASIEEAQNALCPPHRMFRTGAGKRAPSMTNCFALYRKLYFGFGREESAAGGARRRAAGFAQHRGRRLRRA